MANQPKKVRKPKKQKVKQGHKLVWLTLAIILIPLGIIGYVLFNSARGNDRPVEGSRYSREDLNPRIDQDSMDSILSEIQGIENVENATINLNSATLRVHLDVADNLDTEAVKQIAESAYNTVNNYLPIDTYFTDSDQGKNYDLEIDAYTYIVDDSHPADGQVYVKITKNGPGSKVVDVLTQAKDPELAESVHTVGANVPQAPTEDLNGDGVVDENDTPEQDQDAEQ